VAAAEGAQQTTTYSGPELAAGGHTDTLGRREALLGGVTALAALMIARFPAARAAPQPGQDPRYAFAEKLCDLVIPETDTPGGAKTGAAGFVLLAIDHGMNDLEENSLQTVRESLQKAGGADFLHLARAQQTRLLAALDARAFAHSASGSAGTAEESWRRLKPAIIAGYYTSEIGASQELVYEPVPGPKRMNFVLTPDYRSRSNEDFGGSL
jgi:hypothetical protein